MPVEFLGIAATNDGSEITARSGASFDKDYTLRLARAHEENGWDRVVPGGAGRQRGRHLRQAIQPEGHAGGFSAASTARSAAGKISVTSVPSYACPRR